MVHCLRGPKSYSSYLCSWPLPHGAAGLSARNKDHLPLPLTEVWPRGQSVPTPKSESGMTRGNTRSPAFSHPCRKSLGWLAHWPKNHEIAKENLSLTNSWKGVSLVTLIQPIGHMAIGQLVFVSASSFGVLCYAVLSQKLTALKINENSTPEQGEHHLVWALLTVRLLMDVPIFVKHLVTVLQKLLWLPPLIEDIFFPRWKCRYVL